jgi:CHAT domain-containing protein
MRRYRQPAFRALLLVAALCGAPVKATEPSFKPTPAYSPEAQSVREAATLKREGNRLFEEGHPGEAREKWLAAVDAYQQAGYKPGESEVLLQLGVSYQPEIMSDPEKMNLMFDFMRRGALVAAEFLDDLTRKVEPADRKPYQEADALLRRASELSQSGDCAAALPVFEQAGQSYRKAAFPAGELRSLIGRLRCQPKGGGDFLTTLAALKIIPEFSQVAEKLKGKMKAGPSIRYLKAVEDSEFGNWPPAELALRAVLQEFEQSGDAASAGRAALDLGCVLVQEKKPEAELFFRRAQKGLADREDPESRRNLAAAMQNLAGLDASAASATAQTSGSERQLEEPPKPQVPAATVLPVKEPFGASPSPEPSGLEPRAQARRVAVFIMGDGDRLKAAGKLAEAREKWKAAAEAFKRAEDPMGLSDAYRRLGDSYAVGSLLDEGKQRLFVEYFIASMSAAADAYESSVRKEIPLDAEALAKADAIRREATGLCESGGCERALPLLAEARSLYQRAGLAMGEARALILKARCLARSGDYVAASMTMFEAAQIAEALPLGSPTTEIESRADDLFDHGKWQEANEAYQDLLCRSERNRDAPGIARALLGLGRLQNGLGDYSAAEVSLQRALGLLPFVDPESGEKREALARQLLGLVYFSTGRVDEGAAELRRMREVYRRVGQPEQEVSSLRRLATGLTECGEYAAALSVLDEAEALRSHLPTDTEAEADLASVRSFTEFQLGNFKEVLGLLFKARDLYREGGNTQSATAALYTLAGLQDFLGRHEEALGLYQEIAGERRLDDSSVLKQLASVATLMVLLRNERFQEAVELGRRILPFWVQSDNPLGEAMVRSLLGMSYTGLGKLDEARSELDQAASVSKKVEGSGASQDMVLMTTTLGQLEQKAKSMLQPGGPPLDQDRGLAFLDDLAKNLQQKIQTLESSSPASGSPAELGLRTFKFLERYASRDSEGAQLAMGETISLLDQWGKGLTLSELKTPFFDQFFRIYSTGVELSLERPDVAFRYAEQARARSFINQIGNQKIDPRHATDPEFAGEERRLRLHLVHLSKDLRSEQAKALPEQSPERLANLQSALEKAGKNYEELGLRLKTRNPKYAALIDVKPLSLEEVQQVLDEQTTLVEYFVSESALSKGGTGPVLAWVIDRKGFTMVQLPVTSAEVKNRIAEFRNLIESQQPVRAQATALYRDLFAPLAPHVRHRKLVIVPHGLLHFLPYAALWDAKGRRYFGDAFALSYSPSATALKIARDKKVPVAGPILVAGDPDGSLPRAADEARAVARLYGAEPLVGAAASEGAVTARAGEAGILHLAAHAVLNPINPLFTRIELAPDAGHDGNLEMQEVFGLDLSKTGLVVLSACSTQMGKLSAGDELAGLTRAFLYAGTPAVVSSLWDVKDESTSFFMERFYTHLRKEMGRAEALRLAQMETRRKFPHPYQWAAFVLTGDGR